MPPSNPQSTGCIPIAGPSYGTQPTFDLSALTSPSAAAVPDYLGPSPFRPRFSQARRAGESPCALAARRGSASASPPSGLAVPPRNFALEPNAVCTFGQTMVQRGELVLLDGSRELTTGQGPNDGSKTAKRWFKSHLRSGPSKKAALGLASRPHSLLGAPREAGQKRRKP